MMRYIKATVVLFVFIFAISCDNVNDLLNQYIEEGPIIYAGKVNELDIQSGYYRVRVNIHPVEDVNRDYCILSWSLSGNIKDSLRVDYIESNYDEVLECYFAIVDFSLSEIQGNLLIEAQNVDKFGNKSLIVSEGAFIYGSIYTSTLINDLITFSPETNEAIFENKIGSVGNLISYELINGEFTDEVFVTESSYLIVNPKPGGIIRSKTKFLMSETDFDTLTTTKYLESTIPKSVQTTLYKESFDEVSNNYPNGYWKHWEDESHKPKDVIFKVVSGAAFDWRPYVRGTLHGVFSRLTHQGGDNWFIVPSIDLTNGTNPVLSFELGFGMYKGYKNFQLMISTDFNGDSDNILGANWKDHTNDLTISTGGTYENVGTNSSWGVQETMSPMLLDLSEYIGHENVYISFRDNAGLEPEGISQLPFTIVSNIEVEMLKNFGAFLESPTK